MRIEILADVEDLELDRVESILEIDEPVFARCKLRTAIRVNRHDERVTVGCTCLPSCLSPVFGEPD